MNCRPYKIYSILLLSGCFGMISCDNETSKSIQNNDGKMMVQAQLVSHENLENVITTTGSILANEAVQLKSEIAGRVEKINFEEGEAVKKGQLLVEIDNAQFYARLNRIKVQLDQAQKNEQRQEKLLAIEGISREVYEQSQLQVADLEAQKAELQALLNNTAIRAPFDGTIGLRSISPGEYVAEGDDIAYLVQNDPIKIDFSIPEKYAGQIDDSSTINFTLTGIKDTMTAEIYAIEPRIDPGSRSLAIRAIAANSNGKLIPGAFAQVTVNLKPFPNAVLIPSSAVITEIDGKSVFVIKNGKAEKRSIETGIRTESKLHVLQGLQLNDTLITTGLLGLKEGTEVGISKFIANENDSIRP